jgi:hypothetical protein
MSRFPKIEILKLRDKQLARIRIKNKLYGGRARCVTFRDIARIYANHAELWDNRGPIALHLDMRGVTTP